MIKYTLGVVISTFSLYVPGLTKTALVVESASSDASINAKAWLIVLTVAWFPLTTYSVAEGSTNTVTEIFESTKLLDNPGEIRSWIWW